jgi:hypothetical protein
MKKEKPLCDSEKALHSIGLYGMVIWHLRHSLLSHHIAMYMTVSLMVIDTQETLAVRKRAFPVISRGF